MGRKESNKQNKGADQTARMRRLVCSIVVRKPPKTGFLMSRPISHTCNCPIEIQCRGVEKENVVIAHGQVNGHNVIVLVQIMVLIYLSHRTDNTVHNELNPYFADTRHKH